MISLHIRYVYVRWLRAFLALFYGCHAINFIGSIRVLSSEKKKWKRFLEIHSIDNKKINGQNTKLNLGKRSVCARPNEFNNMQWQNEYTQWPIRFLPLFIKFDAPYVIAINVDSIVVVLFFPFWCNWNFY